MVLVIQWSYPLAYAALVTISCTSWETTMLLVESFFLLLQRLDPLLIYLVGFSHHLVYFVIRYTSPEHSVNFSFVELSSYHDKIPAPKRQLSSLFLVALNGKLEIK